MKIIGETILKLTYKEPCGRLSLIESLYAGKQDLLRGIKLKSGIKI